MTSSSVIIDDFDPERIAILEHETYAPAAVHKHRPLILPRSLQLVQPNALKRAQILQPLRCVEREKQIRCGFKIETAKTIGPLAFPNLSARRVLPRPDHGFTYYATRRTSSRITSSAAFVLRCSDDEAD